MFILELVKAFFLGIVEGITEWLPVSSTGHLLLLSEFFPLQQDTAFTHMLVEIIQLAAILAVVVFFFHRLNPFSAKKTKAEKVDTWRLWSKILVAVIPGGVAVVGMKVLDIELKSEHFGQAGTELAEKTINAVKDHGLFDKLLISSFDPAILVVCKKIDKACKTGILYSPDRLISMKISTRPVSFAKESGADALHPFHMYVTRLYVERAHRAGIQVNPWTVNKENTAKHLIKLGVDGLITDDAGLMNKLLDK